MAIKFEKIQPGMTLYDRHRETMGNTMATRLRVVYAAKVLRITPSGLIRLVHDSGQTAHTSFRPDGYAHISRGLRNPWPRYLVPAESEPGPTKKETP